MNWSFVFALVAISFAVFAQSGTATVYSDKFQGSKTASGEVYDMNALSAAHRTLPFGSKIKVTNLENGKSVVVKVNDKGAFVEGQIIELSKAAANSLGIAEGKTPQVKLESIGSTAEVEVEPVKVALKKEPAKVVEPKKEVAAKKAPPVAEVKEPAPAKKPVKQDEYGLYKVQVLPSEPNGYGVQIATFTQYSNVLMRVSELQNQYFKNILVSVEPGKKEDETIYRVILGPFPDRETAESYKANLTIKKVKGFVVDLSELKY